MGDKVRETTKGRSRASKEAEKGDDADTDYVKGVRRTCVRFVLKEKRESAKGARAEGENQGGKVVGDRAAGRVCGGYGYPSTDLSNASPRPTEGATRRFEDSLN